MIHRYWLLAIAILPLALRAEQPPPAQLGPLDARSAIREMQVDPQVRVELVACEPQIVDPVAARFDEDGRLWVVEMNDYPEGKKGQSRIRVLTDKDNDGFFETATTFADDLQFATGLQPWKGGVLVTLAGAIIYLKDTNGDGEADLREDCFTGFAEDNTQLRANHPRLGLDNWIYIANGLRGGEARRANGDDAENERARNVKLSGRDFRFDPLNKNHFEAAAGMGQFGLCFDDDGNRFVCSNRNPLKAIVIEDRYLRKSKGFAPNQSGHDVAAAGEASRVYPRNGAWTTSNLHAGQFTAACGVRIYRGNLLPMEFRGNAFICEPTGGLIHREVMTPAGATFHSHSPYDQNSKQKEFLASRDGWFRPVNLDLAPDGSLIVVDMYRAVIEHPHWMPPELRNRTDLRDGDDRGRIYRIVPRKRIIPRKRIVPRKQRANQPLVPQRIGKSTTPELVQFLADENAWLRETAARLLLERKDATAIELLQEMAVNHKQPHARFHALWLLASQGATQDPADQAILLTAMNDENPRVRRQAIIIAEEMASTDTKLRSALLKSLLHEDAQLRFQAMLSCAPIQNEVEAKTLLKAAHLGEGDPWQRYAALLAAGEFAPELAERYIATMNSRPDPATESQVEFAQLWLQATSKASANKQKLLAAILVSDAVDDSPQRTTQRITLLTAWAKFHAGNSLEKTVASFEDRKLSAQLRTLLSAAAEHASDPKLKIGQRVAAVRMLAFEANVADRLLALSDSKHPNEIRLAAVTALGRQNEIEPWEQLLVSLPTQSPTMRQAILAEVVSNEARRELLLTTIANGKLAAREIDRFHSDRLQRSGNDDFRRRASDLLSVKLADRTEVLKRYQPALKTKGDIAAGAAVFKQRCSTCHRVGEIGVDVGPAISDTRTKTAAQLLGDILQPNGAVDANYFGYNLATTDGRVLAGLVVAETSAAITLKQPGGKQFVIARSEIEEFRSTGKSLMPTGLEESIDPQQMADLLTFLKNWRYKNSETKSN